MWAITNTTLRITMYSGNLAIMHLHSVLLKLWSYISTLVFMDHMSLLILEQETLEVKVVCANLSISGCYCTRCHHLSEHYLCRCPVGTGT